MVDVARAAMTKSTGPSILLLLAAARLPAQSLPADSLFDRLIGHWVLRGTIARQATVHDVTFEWLLGREYVQMHEVSRERAPNGSAAYEAVVLTQQLPYHVRLRSRDGLLAMAHGQ
jgi:hypothetical protein